MWPKFDLGNLLAFKDACVEVAEHVNKAWQEIAAEVVHAFNMQQLALVEIAQVYTDIRQAELERQAAATKPRTRRFVVELTDG